MLSPVSGVGVDETRPDPPELVLLNDAVRFPRDIPAQTQSLGTECCDSCWQDALRNPLGRGCNYLQTRELDGNLLLIVH